MTDHGHSRDKLRLDKWLWAARFFKTRSLAKHAIEGGKVHLAGQRVKVSREISVGTPVVTVSPADVFVSGTDACGTVNPASLEPNTFCVPGDYPVTLTVDDGNGNETTCEATVTITDARPAPSQYRVGVPDADEIKRAKPRADPE